MASLHVFSTVQTATRPHEFSTEFSSSLDELAELYGDNVIPKDGQMILSDAPGLGIKLNENAVAKMIK
jgi:L-alanine-DL-glutamate epimerase-like enolase superfamily enzyme